MLSAPNVTSALGESQVEMTANTVAGDFLVLAELGELSATANLENTADVASQFAFRTASTQLVSVTDTLTPALSTTQSEITVNASIAEILEIVSGDDQSAVVGTRFDEELTVQVRDRFGNPIIGEPINFAVPDTGASARLLQTNLLTDMAGQVTTGAIANEQVRDYTVQISLFKLLETLRLSNAELINTEPPNTDSTNLVECFRHWNCGTHDRIL